MSYVHDLDASRIERESAAHRLWEPVEFVGQRGTIAYYASKKREGVDMSYYRHVAEEVAVVIGGAVRAILRFGHVVYLVARRE